MRQIKYIMDKVGFTILDFEFNDVNGGSISVTVSPTGTECTTKLVGVLALEKEMKFHTVDPWKEFSEKMEENKNKFLEIIGDFREQGLKIAGLGASTKGNVTLQTWGVTKEYIKMVGDVNPDKTNCFTPGTWIPIDVEDFVLEKYDIFVILPWHFRNFFVRNEKFKGKTLVFPLPTPEVVVP